MPTPEEVIKVIADNLPSPFALDDGPEPDAQQSSKDEWRKMADAVIALFQ